MRVHVVSDVHGNVEALARAADGADALFVLGDLVDFVDYANPTAGILGRVLGEQVSREFGRVRRAGGPGELAAFAKAAWGRIPDPAAVIAEAVDEQYAALFAVMPDDTWAIPGNVDLPDRWPAHLRPGITVPDGKVVEIGGMRVAFLGGVPLPPGFPPRLGGPWRPHLVAAEDYQASVDALADFDLLCTHAPPAVPALFYDVVTKRRELPGLGLRELIERERPRAALFGHVHQPLAARLRYGATECVNVGHFRRTGQPYVLRW
ncbi:metallophosphoesterase family protein [Pseudonocardia pini]|uniref:metallophosphoesterase family protein n=1 Tax=Pseudonocardia pini TaxID=2758030 RepID=UPI0015F0CBE0|nr:metallophosphoesterase [Pseudonocardia pini]